MARRRWVAVGVVLACAIAAGAGWARSAGRITIGQTVNSGFPCLVEMTAVQTNVTSGDSFVVPSGTWHLTNWSVSAAGTTGSLAAVIFTQTGPHSFTADAVSPTETPVPNTLNTFPWSVTVHGGQILGFWVDGTGGACLHETGNPSDTIEIVTGHGEPSEGSTVSTSTQGIDILNIAAFLDPPVAEDAVDHVYTCYSKWEQDGGEVDDPAQAAALVAAGRWYPTALPGNVDGGENVGGYHLACNPPATAQPTGRYIGIGGAIGSSWTEGAYAIAD